jgi:hypothetical protein
MVSFGLLRRVALVRTDVSEEGNASFIKVTRIAELGKILAETSNRPTLRRNTKWYFVFFIFAACVIVTAVKTSNLESFVTEHAQFMVCWTWGLSSEIIATHFLAL